MESYIQLTPLNNYLSNCVVKLRMKLLTPNLPLGNCVTKLHAHIPSVFGGMLTDPKNLWGILEMKCSHLWAFCFPKFTISFKKFSLMILGGYLLDTHGAISWEEMKKIHQFLSHVPPSAVGITPIGLALA